MIIMYVFSIYMLLIYLINTTIVVYGVYYSSDSGATWLQATGAPTTIYGLAASGSGQSMVAAAHPSK